jgi:hypothetical protein
MRMCVRIRARGYAVTTYGVLDGECDLIGDDGRSEREKRKELHCGGIRIVRERQGRAGLGGLVKGVRQGVAGGTKLQMPRGADISDQICHGLMAVLSYSYSLGSAYRNISRILENRTNHRLMVFRLFCEGDNLRVRCHRAEITARNIVPWHMVMHRITATDRNRDDWM